MFEWMKGLSMLGDVVRAKEESEAAFMKHVDDVIFRETRHLRGEIVALESMVKAADERGASLSERVANLEQIVRTLLLEAQKAKAKVKERPRAEKGLRTCQQCQKAFMAYRKDKKFCSDVCRNGFNVRRRRNTPVERYGKPGRPRKDQGAQG